MLTQLSEGYTTADAVSDDDGHEYRITDVTSTGYIVTRDDGVEEFVEFLDEQVEVEIGRVI